MAKIPPPSQLSACRSVKQVPELSVTEQAVLHSSLKALCKKHLNPHLLWQQQDEETTDALRRDACKECPFLSRFEDAWPVEFLVHHMLSAWRSALKRRPRTSAKAKKASSKTQTHSKRPARARKPRYAPTSEPSVEDESASEDDTHGSNEGASARRSHEAAGSSGIGNASMEVDRPAQNFEVDGDQTQDDLQDFVRELMYPGSDGTTAHQNGGDATAGPSSSANPRQAMNALSSLSSLPTSGASTPVASGSRLPRLNIDVHAPRTSGAFSPVTASSSTVSPQLGSPVLQVIRVAPSSHPDHAAALPAASVPAAASDAVRRHAQPYVLAFLRGVDPLLATPDIVRRFVDAGIVQRADVLACARLPERDLLVMLRRDLGLNTLLSWMVRVALQRV